MVKVGDDLLVVARFDVDVFLHLDWLLVIGGLVCMRSGVYFAKS